jgi:hypothetical protein
MPEPAPDRPDVVPIPMRERIFAFTAGLTYSEYLDQAGASADIIRRRYGMVQLAPADQLFLVTCPDWYYLVLLVTEEIPDTLMVLPTVARLAAASPRLSLRIVRDDDDLSLLNRLVDDMDLEADLADLDLPLLFIFDDEWNQQALWGPRPQAAEDRLDQWLADHPEYEDLLADDTVEDADELAGLMEDLTHEMRVWYNDDLTQACISEIVAELKDLQADDDADE